MKKYYKYIIILLVFFLIFANLISICYSINIDKLIQKSKKIEFSKNKLPEYHFSIILQNIEEPYLKEVENGINETAKEENAVIEMNYTSALNNYQDAVKYMNIAIDSKVNGIITHGFNNADFQSLVVKAEKNNIPVILLDSDASLDKRAAYIGTDSFDVGSSLGKLVVQATKGSANVAFILDNSDDSNKKLEGFKNEIKTYRNIKIVADNEYSELGIVGANNVTQDILNNYPEVNVLVCPNSKDTIGAAQLVIDLNRVGDIAIIGFDNDPQILKYIQKGVIFATIVPDGNSIGKESIKTLVSSIKNRELPSSINTNLKIITKDNIK